MRKELKHTRQAVDPLYDKDKEDLIEKLKEDANKASGRKVKSRKLTGGLLLLAVAVGVAGVVAAPFTGGASLAATLAAATSTGVATGIIAGGTALLAGVGATLFYKGTRRGFSKKLNTLATKTEKTLEAEGKIRLKKLAEKALNQAEQRRKPA